MTQNVVARKRIRHNLRIETLSLIGDPDRQTPARARNREMDLLMGTIPVPVHHGVHHTFPDRHPDPVHVFFPEPSLTRQIEGGPLGYIHTLQRRVQDLVDGLRLAFQSLLP